MRTSHSSQDSHTSSPIAVPSGRPSSSRRIMSCSLESAMSSPVPVPSLAFGALPRHWLNQEDAQNTSTIAAPVLAGLKAAKSTNDFLSCLVPQSSIPCTPPPVSAYFCRAWSMYFSEDPSHVMSSIKAICAEFDGLDFDMSRSFPAEWAIRGIVYQGGRAVHFSVVAHATTAILASPWPFLIEFQRRQGDQMAFREFYLAVIGALSADVRLFPVGKGIVAPFEFPDDEYTSPEESGISSDGLKCLLSMVTSPCIDTRHEALVSLIRSTADIASDRHCLIHDHQSLLAISNMVMASDPETVRCATTIMANISQAESGRSALLRVHVVESILCLLESPIPEIMRQSARCIYNVAQTHASRLPLSTRHVRTLNRCRFADDPRVHHLITAVLDVIDHIGATSLFLYQTRGTHFDEQTPLSV